MRGMPFSPPPTPAATVTQQIGREERQHTASENFDKIAKKLSENFQRMPKAPTANSQGKLVLKRTSSMDTNNNTVIGIDDGELKPLKTPATMAFTIPQPQRMMGRLDAEKPFSRHSMNSYGNGESGQQSDMNLAKPRQTLVPRKPEIVDVSVPLGTRQLQNPSVGAAAKGGMVVPSAAWSDRLRETTSVADPIALMRAVNGGNGRSTLPSSAQPVPMQHIALQAQLRSLQQAIEAKKIAEARENDLDKGNTLALYTAPIGPMPALSSTGATDSRRTTMDDSMKRSLSDVLLKMRSDDYSKRSATASAEKGSGRETPISTRRPVTPVPPVAAPPVIERATLAPVPPSAFVNDTQHQGKKGRRPSVLPALRTTDLTVGQLKPLPAIDIPDRRKLSTSPKDGRSRFSLKTMLNSNYNPRRWPFWVKICLFALAIVIPTIFFVIMFMSGYTSNGPANGRIINGVSPSTLAPGTSGSNNSSKVNIVISPLS